MEENNNRNNNDNRSNNNGNSRNNNNNSNSNNRNNYRKNRYSKYKKKPVNNDQAPQANNSRGKNEKNEKSEKGQDPKPFIPKRNFRKRGSYKKNRNFNKRNENIVYEICPICEKEIRSPAYAIKDKESEKNAHFECIQKKLLDKEDVNLSENEKLYYLGGGSFGVVLEKRYRGKLKIIIKNRYQY